MTQDEIIEMARQANFLTHPENTYIISPHPSEDADLYEELKAFAKLVAAKERQAVLEMAYGYASNLSWNEDFQADIRARGEA